MSALGAADRQALADALHADIDGDFLVGAGRTIGMEGRDVPLGEARVSEVVWWAVEAVAPVVARIRDDAVEAALALTRPGSCPVERCIAVAGHPFGHVLGDTPSVTHEG